MDNEQDGESGKTAKQPTKKAEPKRPSKTSLGRRQAIPILYTRGTYYEVGFDMGRNFASIIKNFLSICGPLNSTYLPLYDTELGKRAYNETLAVVTENFPQYVTELQGVADGAEVEFHKLFLLHMDEILPQSLKFQYSTENEVPVEDAKVRKEPKQSVAENEQREFATGCSSLILNLRSCRVLAHTEDALSPQLNHYYFVCAHIVEAEPQGVHKVKEERFMSLCYAGHLPGYTMGYNHHGLVFSVNTLSALKLRAGKTPRHFLTRALLSADCYNQAVKVLQDNGVGAGDGCSINMAFVSPACSGKPNTCYNIELVPAFEDDVVETVLHIREIMDGDCAFHCNKYERADVEEDNETMFSSSCQRMETFTNSKTPKNIKDIIEIMGENSHGEFSIFRDSDDPQQEVKTICFGLFDLNTRTINLYSDNPRFNQPLVSIPLNLQKC